MGPAFYFLTFLGSLVVLIHLVTQDRKVVTSVVMLSLMVCVNSLGRYLMSVSTTLELAQLANLFLYVGRCFAPMFFILTLGAYSRTHLAKPLLVFLWSFSAVIFCMALTIGHSQLFYANVSLDRSGSFTRLLADYGPAHVLYPILVTVDCAVILGILVDSFRRYREIPFPSIVLFAFLVVLIIGAYCVEQLFHSRISYISANYLLALIFLVRRVDQLNLYDLPTNIANSIDSLNEIGYLEFDSEYRCTGYNRCMKELFPEIDETCQIGKVPLQNDTDLYYDVILWMYCREPDEVGTLKRNGRIFDMRVRNISYRKKPCVGYLLELVDRTAEKNWLASVESYNEQLKKDVADQTAHISYIKDMMVVGMATMVESRDDSTGEHIKRTYEVMRTFSRHLLQYADRLHLTPEFLEMVTRAAPMHDLGKITIRDSVLKKQGRFDKDDYEIMKHHPAEGAKIVHYILSGVEEPEFVTLAENVAHYHHERWDGKGYPEGLKGEEIPLEARLMALPDVCDALLSKRCYKDPMPMDQVFSILEDSLGTQFDPVYGRLFLECRPKIEAMYKKWYQEDRDNRLLEMGPVTQPRA